MLWKNWQFFHNVKGDFDGDQASVFALLTEEAQQEAKEKLSPIHSNSAWYKGGGMNNIAFELTHDAAMAVYAATKQ